MVNWVMGLACMQHSSANDTLGHRSASLWAACDDQHHAMFKHNSKMRVKSRTCEQRRPRMKQPKSMPASNWQHWRVVTADVERTKPGPLCLS
jgi:hypothetical protein